MSATTSIKVLVVDDAAFTRDLLKKGLRSVFPGFKIEEAVNGKQAQNKLIGSGFDLILCDWEMPEMTGDELLEWARGHEQTQSVPFVMVTSRGDRDHVVKAVQLGVSAYLAKPFTTDKLVEVVAKVLAKSKNLDLNQLRQIGGGDRRGIMKNSAVEALGAKAVGEGDIGLSGAIPIAARIDTTQAKPAASGGSDSFKPSDKMLVPLRFGNAATQCLVREISTSGIDGVMHTGSALPAILDLTVFDFKHADDDGMERINGYVHALQARDNRRETEFVNISIKFIDDDPAKMGHLQRYIASLQTA